jgi:hypothetical protein
LYELVGVLLCAVSRGNLANSLIQYRHVTTCNYYASFYFINIHIRSFDADAYRPLWLSADVTTDEIYAMCMIAIDDVKLVISGTESSRFVTATSSEWTMMYIGGQFT